MSSRISSVGTAVLLLAAAAAPEAADPPYGYGAAPQPGWTSPYGVPAWGGMPPSTPGSTSASPYGTQQPSYGSVPPSTPGSVWSSPYGAQTPPQPSYGGVPSSAPGSGWNSPYYGTQVPGQPTYGGMPPAAPGTAWGSPYGSQLPSYGGMPGATTYPPYGQVQAQIMEAAPPRVELQLSDPAPYIQQSVILTVRLISNASLPEATPEPPNAGAALIQPLDGPHVSVRQQGAKRDVVNDFRFVLTPLENGDLALPGLRVRGSLAAATGGLGRPFDVRSDPVRLSVRPAAAEAQPWLPLYHLAMRGYLTGDDQPVAGKPIGLAVEVTAVGATGGQLPSAEHALRKATDFSVYLESSDVEGGVTPDGRFITGRRLERYTLVPQYGGKLHVPAVKVPWFNLSAGRQETTELPIRQIVAEGPPPPEDPLRFTGGDLVPSGSARWLFWTPLFLLVPVMLGYAVMLFSPPPLATARTAQQETAAGPSRLAGWLGKLADAISPWRLAEWLRPRIASALPVAARLWFCLRIVEREDDPEDWAMLLKFLSAKHLGISAQLPLPELGEEIVRHAARRADPTRVRQLMVELDDALYGGKPITNFTAWKRAFRRETRPRLFARRRAGGPSSHDLPALNPPGKV